MHIFKILNESDNKREKMLWYGHKQGSVFFFMVFLFSLFNSEFYFSEKVEVHTKQFNLMDLACLE